MANLVSVISKFYGEYVKSTPKKLKVIDAYLLYILLTGIVQFVYCCLVGTFPFNSFLSGFISCVSSFVLAGLLEDLVQAVDEGNQIHACLNDFEKAFDKVAYGILMRKADELHAVKWGSHLILEGCHREVCLDHGQMKMNACKTKIVRFTGKRVKSRDVYRCEGQEIGSGALGVDGVEWLRRAEELGKLAKGVRAEGQALWHDDAAYIGARSRGIMWGQDGEDEGNISDDEGDGLEFIEGMGKCGEAGQVIQVGNGGAKGGSWVAGRFYLSPVCLRLQVNPQNRSQFYGISPERGFADFIFAHIILHIVVINFIG
ncbi:hypothetical protein PR048_024187 [Dryococelus australis]|uniref:Dolichyl-diphosphooligosaccharide--protein glycosyltransferase subunit DAD1 n=1 Tax=Dryococelus australis TaxID=614101 RepID=A0ABQ9GW90_9NEOP|nr:hypothetical protein PR048_024187 [Dryococelus australis]